MFSSLLDLSMDASIRASQAFSRGQVEWKRVEEGRLWRAISRRNGNQVLSAILQPDDARWAVISILGELNQPQCLTVERMTRVNNGDGFFL
jgi:hypothetical protein